MKRKSRAQYLAEGILMILWVVMILIVTLLLWKRGEDMGFVLFLLVVLLGIGVYDVYRWFRYDQIKWSEEDLRPLTRRECRNALLADGFSLLMWLLVLWLRVKTYRRLEDDLLDLFMVITYGGLVLECGMRVIFAWLKYIRAGERDDLPAGTN